MSGGTRGFYQLKFPYGTALQNDGRMGQCGMALDPEPIQFLDSEQSVHKHNLHPCTTYLCFRASTYINPGFFFPMNCLLGVRSQQHPKVSGGHRYQAGPLSSTNPQQEADGTGSYGYKGLAALLLSFFWAFLQEVSKVQIFYSPLATKYDIPFQRMKAPVKVSP